MFEFVYYVLSADYTEFMNVQQRINFAIYRKFEEEDLDFAFPTQTLHLQAAQHIEYGGDIPDSRSPARERAARKETPPLPEEDT
jgi:small-conductance mechanosensitive channel